MKMRNKSTPYFYTYIYFDPRKPGPFIYGDLSFDHEPFYVGKGYGKQYLSRLKMVKFSKKQDYRWWVSNKIRKIQKEGKDPIIQFYEKDISEDVAFWIEIHLIAEIGRKDLKKGPLLNLTNGGEGISGHIFSLETKKKISKANLGKSPSDATKKLWSKQRKGEGNGMYGKHRSEETKEKIRTNSNNAQRGEKNGMYRKCHTLESIIKMKKPRRYTEKMKGPKTETHKKAMSMAALRRYAKRIDPEFLLEEKE